MPAMTLPPKAVSLTELPAHIARIFDQAQLNTANHQKNLVALHKLHVEAALVTESVRKGKGVKLTGERAFDDAFALMVSRVLPVKKGATPAERIVKFVGGYTRFVNEKAAEDKALSNDDEDDGDTTASRFTERLLSFLLRGFAAKDKTVRFRVIQMVAEMVSHLGEVDEEIYSQLRTSLLDRTHDKETFVRVQAVIALSKLSGTDDPAELEDGEPTVVDALIDILNYDPAPDVRRAALGNIPVNPNTLPSILARSRDTDTASRRLIYTHIMNPQLQRESANEHTHPRALSIAQRELIVRNGLGDREPTVRAAAAILLGTWLDVVGETEAAVKPEEGKEVKEGKKIEEDVVKLLKLFDLNESTIAEDALLSVFATRVDIFNELEFGDAFWEHLAPETAFLARVFVDNCIAMKDDARLEAALPVVTALAFRIQSAYNDLVEEMQREEEEILLGNFLSEEERVKKEEARLEKEFIIGEMLKLAVNLDYADEIGRRKMFQLVRDMISQEALPESLVTRCLDVLRVLSANERDLIRVVVEVVHDLRDPASNDDEENAVKDGDADVSYLETPATVRPPRAPVFAKPAAELSPEEQARADALDMRCLTLCIGMLERVNGKLEENVTLEGILAELIVPAVKRKEMALREKGLVALGLCCLIARPMALRSFTLFQSQMQSAPEVLKLYVLQIIFDILMVHEGDFLGKGGETAENIRKFLLHVLGQETDEKVQALICMGTAKLVLAGMISDDRVLKNLIMAYLSPSTVDNQELRQCLSYFFPVFCYSAPANQRRMQQIFIPMFNELIVMRKDLDEDEEMISSAQMGAIFVDWTDPLKVIETNGKGGDEKVQFDMATDILKALLKQDLEKEDKKVLCQLLGKLHIPDVVDDDKIRSLKLLMNNLRSRRPLRDTTANNAFTKFDTAIGKKFEKQLENLNEEEMRKLENLKNLFEFLDEIIPLDDDEVVDPDAPKRKGRKRRSDSVTSSGSDTPTATVKREKAKGKAKKPRLTNSDEEDADDASTTAAPTRTLPKRAAAAAKKPPSVIVISSDDDEDDTPPRKRAAATRATKVEATDDVDDLSVEVPHDSIMDDSEEEEEVNDLILGDGD